MVVRAGDYYDALGVSKGSSKKEIKTAYRQMARKFHPDVNKESGAEERFKTISEAYALDAHSCSLLFPAWPDSCASSAPPGMCPECLNHAQYSTFSPPRY